MSSHLRGLAAVVPRLVCVVCFVIFFFFSSRRRHTRCLSDWSSDVCSSDLGNIRELENFIERCVILTQGDELNVPRAELNRSSGRTVVATRSEERRVWEE